MRKKINLLFLVVVLVQICLLVNMVTAESYSISQTNVVKYENDFGERILKVFEKVSGVLVGLVSIKEIGIVSAQSLQKCCLRGEFGVCQNFVEGENLICEEVVDTAVNWVVALMMRRELVMQISRKENATGLGNLMHNVMLRNVKWVVV